MLKNETIFWQDPTLDMSCVCAVVLNLETCESRWNVKLFRHGNHVVIKGLIPGNDQPWIYAEKWQQQKPWHWLTSNYGFKHCCFEGCRKLNDPDFLFTKKWLTLFFVINHLRICWHLLLTVGQKFDQFEKNHHMIIFWVPFTSQKNLSLGIADPSNQGAPKTNPPGFPAHLQHCGCTLSLSLSLCKTNVYDMAIIYDLCINV